ncbi:MULTISPECIES: PPE domain-containing protein [unclassified Crossiella]|uniref:PPE domain-containing protein n=1 Tax=unclassified Crossiella TaxID=2620835 RepID=UPI0020002404|nr:MULTISPECIES: PPE domain-containing protein [unclassified Crossiella]MCK2238347.1 PPE domain-containing protein [Crossiella sp. S99.2]MCK2256387.1 PPE domain-containing protein [Crossiella sp. S99.1]
MSDHRWQGYSHAELYGQLHNGLGPAASAASITRWSDMSAALADIDADIKQALGNSRADWTGKAAEAADAALHPLAQWARDAQAGAEVMRVSAELQAEYVGKARADMPAPKEVSAEKPNPLVTGVVHLFGGQTDYEIQEAAQSAAEQRAFEVMEVYQTTTAANVSTLGQFSKPPELHLDTGHGSPQSSGPIGATAPPPARPRLVPPARSAPSPVSGRSGSAPVPAPPRPGAPAATGSSTAPVGPGTRLSGVVTPPPATPAPSTGTSATAPSGTGTTPAPARGLPHPRVESTTSSAATTRPGPQHRPAWDAAEATHLAESRRGSAAPDGVLGLDPEPAPAARSAAAAPVGRARREEDGEHQSFLVEDDDVFGDARQYAPPVIGE